MHAMPDTSGLKIKDKKEAAHIRSFYHLAQVGEPIEHQHCQGTACFVARHLNPGCWQAATSQEHRVYCLGSCFVAPASSSEVSRPRITIRSSEPIVLGPMLEGPISSISMSIARGGYRALEEALNRPPTDLVNSIEASGLRGRGGAGFPTGKKWRAVAGQKVSEKFVVANADEGDPGAYIDRFLLEDDPYRLLEAMTIAAYAIGATQGYIYLRKEYPHARMALERALLEARREGFLGERVVGSDFSFDVELIIGQGSYVCGEETALLNSIEGRRPEVQLRPPYPSEWGLFGKPTLINNVETLASIPWIVRNGADGFQHLGFSTSRGTKVLSLNSLFRTPGLYEVEFGMSLRKIVEDLGGGLKSGTVRGVIVGGPLAGIIPLNLLDTQLGFSTSRGTKVLSLNSLFRTPGLYEVEFGMSLRKIVEDGGGGLKSGTVRGVIVGGPLAGIIPLNLLDTQLGFEELAKIGASVGHGGVIAFDEHTSIAQLIHHVFEFAAYESCGKCTPCRRGSQRIEQIFKQIVREGCAPAHQEKECMEIVSALGMTSLCGLGTGLAEFARSALRHYGNELEPCFR